MFETKKQLRRKISKLQSDLAKEREKNRVSSVVESAARAELTPLKDGATALGRNCTIQAGSLHVDGKIKFEAL